MTAAARGLEGSNVTPDPPPPAPPPEEAALVDALIAAAERRERHNNAARRWDQEVQRLREQLVKRLLGSRWDVSVHLNETTPSPKV